MPRFMESRTWAIRDNFWVGVVAEMEWAAKKLISEEPRACIGQSCIILFEKFWILSACNLPKAVIVPKFVLLFWDVRGTGTNTYANIFSQKDKKDTILFLRKFKHWKLFLAKNSDFITCVVYIIAFNSLRLVRFYKITWSGSIFLSFSLIAH